MTASTSDERAARPSGPGSSGVSRILGHPAAYAVTAAILLLLFAWPFIGGDRVAPTKDPAYYTWRTEALITEDPLTLLEIEGPNGIFAAGYRVAAPVIGGLLRHVVGVGSLSVTVFLMVGLPVGIALLLAAFARRIIPDPIVWHATAVAAAGLLLTPPFVGYLDNVLCLFFLAASLHFLAAAAAGWPARLVLFMMLLLAGFTHPTTLVIFCVVLGGMSVVRLIAVRFDFKDVIRADGWMLGVGAAAAIATYLIWTIGLWGKSVSLVEAALPPPYGSDFFVDRMLLWVDAMRPALNGVLFLLGVAVLVARGRDTWRDHDTRVTLVWLAPLAGCFGFIAGLTYPYYRFFNTTLSWVLLAGIGAGVALRFFLTRATDGRQPVLYVGAVAVLAILVTNLTSGFQVSGWTKEKNQWLEPAARADLDVLRGALELESRDRPIVFAIDDEPPDPFQIYGFAKLSGNTSRYGLPAGQIDRGYLYLGDVENLLRGEPTETGDETYDPLSEDLLADSEEGFEKSGEPPLIVVAQAFNPAGANAELAAGEAELTQEPSGLPDGTQVWTLYDGNIYEWADGRPVGLERSGLPEEPPNALVNLLLIVVGLALLLLPGMLVLRRALPEATIADALGLVPALGLGLTSLTGIVVLALLRSPYSGGLAWLTVLAAITVGVIVLVGPRRTSP